MRTALKQENCNFGVAVVKTIEAKLLSHDRLLRMIDAADFQSAYSVLAETEYAKMPAQAASAFGCLESFDGEVLRLRALTDSIAPGSEMIASIWKRFDFANARTILKSALLGREADRALLSDAGTIPLPDIIEGISGRKRVSEEIDVATEDARKTYGATSDLRDVDVAIDRGYFAYILKAAERSGSAFFRSYALAVIDVHNIKTLLRAKSAGDAALLARLVPGGSIDPDRIRSMFGSSPEEIARGLRYTDYSAPLAEGLRAYSESGSFHVLERMFDDHLTAMLREARYYASGVEPIFAYATARLNELRSLKVILEGKATGARREKLTERLRITYV